MVDCIGSLGGSHVMRFRANTANAVGQQGHFLNRPANTESLKTAQFRDLEIGIVDLAIFIQEDFDLAVTFQAGDGIN